MSSREQVRNEILAIPNNNILLELPTSYGKTKIALELLDKKATLQSKILIVIPRLTLIDTWKDELKKWKYWDKFTNNITFVTYVSFPKKAGVWDIVIFDEAHHLSQRCQDALEDFIIHNSILLSATVGRQRRKDFKYLFKNLYTYYVTIKEATQEEVLPDPTVYLIPLELDNTKITCEIIKNKKQKIIMTVPFKDRWSVKDIKNRKIIIPCTQKQFYTDISNLIAYYKNKMYIERYKNLYLQKCGERLKWLSNQKTALVKQLLIKYDKERTLTFCNSILQTEELGTYCINSKNKISAEILDTFNNKKINHITACDMLNEGVNLTDCRIGIYATLNSSERMIKQKLGRLLRHPHPIIIIPYFKDTRDEEIVKKMCEDYNPDLIHTIKI